MTELPDQRGPTAELVFPVLTAHPERKAMTVSRARMAQLVKAALRERLVRKARPAQRELKVPRVAPETANL